VNEQVSQSLNWFAPVKYRFVTKEYYWGNLSERRYSDPTAVMVDMERRQHTIMLSMEVFAL
jgi:hypothetical protein